MKRNILKITTLCAAALLSMSSCIRDPIVPYDYSTGDIQTTLDQLAAVNTVERALENHENCYVTVNLKGEDYWGTGTYQDNDMYFREYFGASQENYQSTIYFDGQRWHLRYDEEGKPDLTFDWLVMSDAEKYENIFKPDRTVIWYDSEIYDRETVIDITEEDNGTITIHTRNSDGEVQAMTDKYNLHNTKYWFATLEHEYTFNRETLELEYDKNYIGLQNGKRYIYYTTLVQYDVLPPDYMKMTKATVEMTVNDDEAVNRTLTAVYDYGTAKEETFTIQYNGKYRVNVIGRDGYTAYTDTSRQNVFDGNVPYSDFTIYYFKD